MQKNFLRRIVLTSVALTIAGGCLLFPRPIQAKQLVVGIVQEPRTLDPHFQDLAANNAIALHLFDALVRMDENQKLHPGLAVSWRAVDPLTWEFKLRRGVLFHDGSQFTAEDVIFTVQRVSRVPHSPAPFTRYTRPISAMEAPAEDALIIRTSTPTPLLPALLSRVMIMSRKATEGKSTQDLDGGNGLVGTGPYRISAWTPGKQLVVTRHEEYWEGMQPWEHVVFKEIRSEKLRIKALQQNSLQVIERLSPTSVNDLQKDRRIEVQTGASNRIIYLHLDSNRSISPYIRDVEDNPLQKSGVRQAISLAIDRNKIAQEVLDGMGVPTAQLAPKDGFGYVPELQAERPDVRQAIRLLARAGYRHGFGITLHGPNNRFIHDESVVRAIAEMLNRIGLRVGSETMPKNVYFPKARKNDFSLMLAGLQIQFDDPAQAALQLLGTRKKASGFGTLNLGGYTNPALDSLLEKAMITVDPGAREQVTMELVSLGLKDYGIIPLYFEKNAWAARPPIKITPRRDGMTLAMSIHPK